MNARSEWGSVHFPYHNSPGGLTYSDSRAPLSPLSRNVSRANFQCHDTSMLRAAKSLDLESFRSNFPRDKGQSLKHQPPRKLRSFRSRAFRANVDQVDILCDKDSLMSPLEGISGAHSFHFDDDRLQILDARESQVIDSDSESEELEDLSSESGHDYEHEEEYNEAGRCKEHADTDTTFGEGAQPDSSIITQASNTTTLYSHSTPSLHRAFDFDSLDKSLISPPGVNDMFASPEQVVAYSPPSEASGSRGSSSGSDSRPTSRHRRALSRIAAIGDIPVLVKTPSHTPLNSPRVDQMCIFTAKDARTCDIMQQPTPGLDSLQNILSQLAYKERRVLEAEHALRDAKADLAMFRERLNTMMDPSHPPVATLCGVPRIISRRHQPNIGIYGLHYVQTVRPRQVQQQQVQQQQPPQRDTAASKGYSSGHSNESIAFRFVHSLLDLVHCIISVIPRHRAIVTAQQEYVWHPEYPSPTRFLYGLEL